MIIKIPKIQLVILAVLVGLFLLTYKGGGNYLVKGLSYIGVSFETPDNNGLTSGRVDSQGLPGQGDTMVTNNNLSDIKTVTITSPKIKVTNSNVPNKIESNQQATIKSNQPSITPSPLLPTPSVSKIPPPSNSPTVAPSPSIRPTSSSEPTPIKTPTPSLTPLPSTPPLNLSALSVVINEIAWMGTEASYTDEWIELYNNTDFDIDLNGWILKSETDLSPNIILIGIIKARNYFLIERTNDLAVSNILADLISSFGKGGLNNSGEVLVLIDASGKEQDRVGGDGLSWYAGDNDQKATMERISALEAGNLPSNWATNSASSIGSIDSAGNTIRGTPGAANNSH